MTDYEWYKVRGICPSCGREKAAPRRVHCLNCLDKVKIRYERRIATQSREAAQAVRENTRKSVKALYDRRRAAGLCLRCGRPTLEGHVLCAEHNAYRRTKARREYREKHPQYPGICRYCERPVKPGYKLCEEHYIQTTTQLADARRKSAKCKGMPPMLFGRLRGERQHDRTV